MQPAGSRTDQPHVVWPWIGVTSLNVDAGTRVRILDEHRNLARKVRRFTARGGRIERVHGPMPGRLRPAMLSGYALNRPPDPSFRELYEAMVAAHWSIPSNDLVHLVAYVGEVPVGYHSFLRSGRLLCLLSGVFDRPTVGTHHAYENVLLGSIDLAIDLGCSRIEYGAAINAVKSSLLDVQPTEIHFVSRIPGVVAGIRAMLPRTLLAVPGRSE
ncbi:MAG: GNAT family N-acetyltransferase [Candidatus Nanopelagicales bacterium]